MSRFLRITNLYLLLLAALTTSNGCQIESASEPEGQSAPIKQVTINVTGMSCALGCAPRVRDALTTLPWAKNVQVNFDRKQATFIAETASYDEAAIIAVLEKEGFGGTVVK